jgi:hypothetical protein
MLKVFRLIGTAAFAAAVLAGCGGPTASSLPPKISPNSTAGGPSAAAPNAKAVAPKSMRIVRRDGTQLSFPMTTKPLATHARRPSMVQRVYPGDGGGCGNFCYDDGFCPDCDWNPEIAAHKPDDFTDVRDPDTACFSFDLSFSSDYSVCLSKPLKRFFRFSSFTYGQCNNGSYTYIDGEYHLRCTAPGGQPLDGIWWVHTEFQTLTGTSEPQGVFTASPGEVFDVYIPVDSQFAFTKTHLCFANSAYIQSPCVSSGGGISVGFK